MKILMAVLISVAISTYLAYTLMKVHNKKYHKKPCGCKNGGDKGGLSDIPLPPVFVEPTPSTEPSDSEPPTVGEIVDALNN